MMTSRASIVRRLYWLLAGYVTLTGFLNVLSHTIFGTRTMREIAVPAMYSWVVIIPLALIAIWFVNREVRREHTNRQRTLMRVSWLPLWTLWLYSGLGYTLYVMANEPWPFNYHHGPDTEYAKKGFEFHVGIPAPPSVSQVHFTSLGWMERHDKLRFRVTDPEVVAQLVDNQELLVAESMEADDHPMLDSLCLSTQKNKNPKLQCYFRNQGRAHWALRYDPETETARYEFISP